MPSQALPAKPCSCQHAMPCQIMLHVKPDATPRHSMTTMQNHATAHDASSHAMSCHAMPSHAMPWPGWHCCCSAGMSMRAHHIHQERQHGSNKATHPLQPVEAGLAPHVRCTTHQGQKQRHTTTTHCSPAAACTGRRPCGPAAPRPHPSHRLPPQPACKREQMGIRWTCACCLKRCERGPAAARPHCKSSPASSASLQQPRAGRSLPTHAHPAASHGMK